jgi:hypothetical protein
METRASFALVPSLLLFVSSGCASSSSRVLVQPEPARAAAATPEPRPQVLLADPNGAPAPAPREQVMVSHMTEAERTEVLRSAGSPIRPYDPGPLTPEVVRYEQTGGAPPAYDWRTDWTQWAAAGATFAMFTMPFFLGWGHGHHH